MNTKLRMLPVLAALLGSAAVVQVAVAQVKVSVEPTHRVSVMTHDLVGIYTQLGDANLLDPTLVGQLRAAGVGVMTYPTGWEGLSQLYHWSTNQTVKPSEGAKPLYSAPGNDFGHFAAFISQFGTALVHVPYGSDLTGKGGGTPQEAAAWVAYANSDPTSTTVIGKDAGGTDWKTAGFWATLRASAPQPVDDGYNFLRQQHPAPFHIVMWVVGEDVSANGFYNGDHHGTPDLHLASSAADKDASHRRGNANLSPAFYGAQVAEYARAMKAVDPNIGVGASGNTPQIDYDWGADWDQKVLKAACSDIDFLSIPWHAGKPQPPDWKTLDEADLLTAPETQLPRIFNEFIYLGKHNCAGGKVPRIVFSQFAPQSWARLEHPSANALFAADAYAVMAESGVSNANWYQLREGGLFAADGKPTAAYYGMQMLHIVAFHAGDAFVEAHSANPLLSAYATQRQDGPIGLLLINKDLHAAQNVTVHLVADKLAPNAIRFDYGEAQQRAGIGPVRSSQPVQSGDFTVKVPAYGIVSLLLVRQ